MVAASNISNRLLKTVNALQGMVDEIAIKQRLLQSRLKTCTSRTEYDILSNGSKFLSNEMDNIIMQIDLVDDLSEISACLEKEKLELTAA